MDITVSDEVSQEYHELVKNILCNREFLKLSLTPTGEHQAFYHPKAAAENSATHFDMTDRELDAILSHMFPLGPLPRNREAWIISFADKACAIAEGCHIAIALARRNRIVINPA